MVLQQRESSGLKLGFRNDACVFPRPYQPYMYLLCAVQDTAANTWETVVGGGIPYRDTGCLQEES